MVLAVTVAPNRLAVMRDALETLHRFPVRGPDRRHRHVVGDLSADNESVAAAAGGLQAGNPAAFLISISSYRRSLSVPVPTFVSLCSTRSYERRNQRDTNNYMILVGDVPMRRLAAMPIGTSNPHTRLSPCTLTDCSPGKPAVPHGGVRRVTLYYVFVTTDLSI